MTSYIATSPAAETIALIAAFQESWIMFCEFTQHSDQSLFLVPVGMGLAEDCDHPLRTRF